MMAIERDRSLEQLSQTGVRLLDFPFLGALRAQLHSRTTREIAERLGKLPSLFLHQELEDVAALIAGSEATPGTALREHDERRRPGIGMEWAESGVVLPRPA